MVPRRQIYAERLREFAEFAFGDEAVFQNRGNWRDFFSTKMGPAFDGRIIFEIGCADGDFLSRVAAKHPRAAFVGIDWKYKSLYLAAERVAGLGIRNVALLRGRAQDVLKIFSEREVDEIWVFHPEPCDREVELKNRLISAPFLMDVHQVLRNESSALCLKTDHLGYYEWVLGLQAIEAVRSRFEVMNTSTDFWNDPAVVAHTSERLFARDTTFFESRFIGKRKPIYYFELRKR